MYLFSVFSYKTFFMIRQDLVMSYQTKIDIKKLFLILNINKLLYMTKFCMYKLLIKTIENRN